MISINERFNYIYEEKKSKFIAHIFEYNRFDEVMKELKEENHKARHFVYAFRYINEFDQIVEGSSDDGEPRGTSGKPSLNVLSGNELINVGVIIVRYFGGTKLGTGGLVRAYGEAVNKVISVSKTFLYEKIINEICEVSYSNLSILEYNAKELGVCLEKLEYLNSSVKVKLSSSKDKLSLILLKSKELIKIT